MKKKKEKRGKDKLTTQKLYTQFYTHSSFKPSEAAADANSTADTCVNVDDDDIEGLFIAANLRNRASLASTISASDEASLKAA